MSSIHPETSEYLLNTPKKKKKNNAFITKIEMNAFRYVRNLEYHTGYDVNKVEAGKSNYGSVQPWKSRKSLGYS